MELIISLLPMILIFVAMYAILIIPQRRRDKKNREMLNALKAGDEITTVGGIIGKVVNIKDDEVTIETGVSMTKVKIARWAVKEVKKVIEA